MTSAKTADESLVSAAAVLESELKQFEVVLADLLRLGITSEKTLERARQSLLECSERQQLMAEHLQGFARAMQATQERQQRCMNQTMEAAQRIQARHDERQSLLVRVAALGTRARELGEPLAGLAGEQASNVPNEVLSSVGEFVLRMEAVIGEAEALATSARETEWMDVARDADTLKQQLQAARNRVLIAQRKIAGQAPS